ncbi:predicted protein [Chaetoceros tenuissimus]|uniref:Uncharacterized protein n=1 Tax=Chaetoceros tenuissimus TaxID=426638 RepID=A0AAD3H4T6_9STRA|nr:predicted protein [Chaetoceros tenuissimus]
MCKFISQNDAKRCAMIKLQRKNSQELFSENCKIFDLETDCGTIHFCPTHFSSSNLEKGPVKQKAANNGPNSFYESVININGRDDICYVPLPSPEIIDKKNTDKGVKVEHDENQDREDVQEVPFPSREIINEENIDEGVELESRDGEDRATVPLSSRGIIYEENIDVLQVEREKELKGKKLF